jgi:N,N-dimethylformamidase
MITGYAQPIAAAPDDRISLKLGASESTVAAVSVVRLGVAGTDPTPSVDSFETPGTVSLGWPETAVGSYVEIEDPAGSLGSLSSFTLCAFVFRRRHVGAATIAGCCSDGEPGGYALEVDPEGRPRLRVGAEAGDATLLGQEPLRPGVWHALAATFDGESGEAVVWNRELRSLASSTVSEVTRTASGGGMILAAGLIPAPAPASAPFALAARAPNRGVRASSHFTGKLAAPGVAARALSAAELAAWSNGGPLPDTVAAWDFAAEITDRGVPSSGITDLGPLGFSGRCVNLPARAMTGPWWSGRNHCFLDAPEEFDAIHFHAQDLEDAGWPTSFEITVPEAAASGIFAVRLAGENGEEGIVPFFVSPRRGSEKSVGLLLPTHSYLAYANNRTPYTADGSQAIIGHATVLGRLDLELDEHPELGQSLYDIHADGSGVCHASWRRPILDLDPDHQSFISGSQWQFNADLRLCEWLAHEDIAYDLLTDEDIDREGIDLLGRYRVIVTGSHPEYVTETGLDSIGGFVRAGGRLMYMGANGYYWVTATHPDKPHLIEMRRGIAGSRAWESEPGESYLAFTGEMGGTWRHRGRAPQRLVGVGFSAEGFDRSSYYLRLPDSFDPRAAFIFAGVDEEGPIGDFGEIGDGAAGLELDRYDAELGSPEDALLLATSVDHTENYLGLVEEIFFNAPGFGGTLNPSVRADMTYFKNDADGAVFTTGSIAWTSSLSHDGYDNDVARITGNVLRQFAGDGPLP